MTLCTELISVKLKCVVHRLYQSVSRGVCTASFHTKGVHCALDYMKDKKAQIQAHILLHIHTYIYIRIHLQCICTTNMSVKAPVNTL